MGKKKQRLALCLIFLGFVAGAYAGENEGMTLWGLTADNAESLLNLRLGYETENRFEAGATIKWTESSPKWGPEPRLYGGYALYHINEFLGIDDPAPDHLWEEWLHALVARAYFGLEVLYDDQDSVVRTSFPIGTLFSVADDEHFKTAFVIEYNWGDSEIDRVVTLGARIRF